MVWIHGGGFRSGSGEIPGGYGAARVVVVSFGIDWAPLAFLRTRPWGLVQRVLACWI